jgi:hypothetical protein
VQLAVTVSAITAVAVVVAFLVGYLIDKSSEV